MTYKTASELQPGDGVEVPGLSGQIVKSVEPYGMSISEARARVWDVLGGQRSPDGPALWVLWESGYRTVVAADYDLRTFDPVKKAEADARLDAAMVRIIHEALK